MNYEEASAFINSAKKFGSRLDLGRIRRLLEILGNPHRGLRYVHVAGTNGKGSTCAFLSCILTRAGYRTGLFISPFIDEFNERIQVNRCNISDSSLLMEMEKVRNAVRQMVQEGDEHPTEFELITAAAFLHFRSERCDIVILETGLGGRLDATNVIEDSLVCVITAIGMDHMQYLGDTISAIAAEKCGIIKPGADVVCYAPQAKEARAVIRKTARDCGGRYLECPANRLVIQESTIAGSVFYFDGICYTIRQGGAYQPYNALTAICTAQALRDKGFIISQDDILKGISDMQWPARFEIISREPLFIIDGSHNLDGVRAFVKTLQNCMQGRRVVCIFSMLRDKEFQKCAKELGKAADAVITYTMQNPRAVSCAELLQAVRPDCAESFCAPNAEAAVRDAIRLAGREGAIFAVGSLYLAAEIRQACERVGIPFKKHDEKTIAFAGKL